MSFLQLYYTSCEHGLSGSVGYQFNATTPGVPPEVMREVEGLSGYDPPDRVGGSPSEAEIEAAPVSLVHRPGAPTVIAHVKYTGADFSKRFGNFFSHALVPSSAADLAGVLPIELWRSPIWVHQESPTTELPTLPSPPVHGSLTAESVGAFLARHPNAGWLAQMTSAAALAIEQGERRVVIIEQSADDAAHWIAGISYLLPPPVAAAMSFTTYSYRPSYSDLHVVGTLPDTQVETGDRAMSQQYYLFDVPNHAATEVPIHPVVRLAATAGLIEASALWRACAAIEPSPGPNLDAWTPVAALAAMSLGAQVDSDDLGTGLQWLVEHAEGLGGQIVHTLGSAAAHQPSFGVAELVLVADAAQRAAVIDLRRWCEQRYVDQQLDELVAGRPWTGPALEITDAQVLAKVGTRCDDQLLDSDPPIVIAMLGWARQLGVPLSDQPLTGLGAGLLGPMFVDRSPSAIEVDAVVGLPAVLDGIASYAAQRAREDPAVVLAAFDRGLGRLLGDAPISAHAELSELQLLSRARNHPERRVEVLEYLIGQKEAAGESVTPIDPRLLEILWPEGRWSPTDAQRLLVVLSDAQVRSGEVPYWFGQVVTGNRARSREYDQFCAAMSAHPGKAYLPDDARQVLDATTLVADDLGRLESVGPADRFPVLLNVVRQVSSAPAGVQAALGEALPPYLLALPRHELAEALRDSPVPVVLAFLDAIQTDLDGADPDVELAADLFIVRRKLWQVDDPMVIPIDKLMRRSLDSWKKRDLKRLLGELERLSPNGRTAFEQWFTEEAPKRSKRESVDDKRPSVERRWGKRS